MTASDKPQKTAMSFWPVAVVAAGGLAVSVAVDVVVGHHGTFGFDGITGFYALFGFAAGLAIIGGAKGIGALLKRPDTFYGDEV